MDAVSEDDTAAGVGVGFAGYERDALVSELGLKAEYTLKPGTTLTGVLAWEHDFSDSGETTLDAEFTDDGVSDTRFAVTSTGFGADIFRVGVGVRVDLGAKAAFSLGYDALLSSESKSGQGIKADVAFRF
jgi:outer membrane autotransporter protein